MGGGPLGRSTHFFRDAPLNPKATLSRLCSNKFPIDPPDSIGDAAVPRMGGRCDETQGRHEYWTTS